MSAHSGATRTNLTNRWAWPHGTFGDLVILLFVLVQGLDGALTYLGVHVFGHGIEANPIVRSAVSLAGVGGGLAAAKLFAVSLGILLHLRRVHLVVAALTVLYLTVAILPWSVLFLSVG